MTVAPEQIPRLPRGVRMHHDRVRDRWVLLAPERVIDLDPIGHAIVSEIDGRASFGAIVATLAAKYEAPADQIRGDAADYIRGLADRRILEVAP